jgi:hypothetical protein
MAGRRDGSDSKRTVGLLGNFLEQCRDLSRQDCFPVTPPHELLVLNLRGFEASVRGYHSSILQAVILAVSVKMLLILIWGFTHSGIFP